MERNNQMKLEEVVRQFKAQNKLSPEHIECLKKSLKVDTRCDIRKAKKIYKLVKNWDYIATSKCNSVSFNVNKATGRWVFNRLKELWGIRDYRKEVINQENPKLFESFYCEHTVKKEVEITKIKCKRVKHLKFWEGFFCRHCHNVMRSYHDFQLGAHVRCAVMYLKKKGVKLSPNIEKLGG